LGEALDVVGQSANDGHLGSKTGESQLRDKPAVVVRFEDLERGNVREHRLMRSNGEANGDAADSGGAVALVVERRRILATSVLQVATAPACHDAGDGG